MWTRIIHTLILYVVIALLTLAGGNIPGFIRIHSSGHAAYITRGRCLVDTEVPYKDFEEYTDWCKDIHRKEHPPK